MTDAKRYSVRIESTYTVEAALSAPRGLALSTKIATRNLALASR